jgi:hypothetical protein
LSLIENPFEPIWDDNKVPSTFLTWKVTFLLPLALGLRRGELHAIPLHGVSFEKDFNWMTFRPKTGFVSKTRIAMGAMSAATLQDPKLQTLGPRGTGV